MKKLQEPSSSRIAPLLRGTIYGSLLTLSLSALLAQAAGADGIFGDYFTRMVTTACGTADGVVTSFDTSGPTFGTKICTSFQTLLSNKNIYTQGGNVGIGVANPTERLDVNGDIKGGQLVSTQYLRFIRGDYGVIFGPNSANNTYMLLTNAGDQYGSYNDLRPFRMDNSNGNIALGKTTLYVQHEGNVGIGVGNPDYKLDVNGDIQARGNIAARRLYDRDDGSYYVDSSNISRLNQLYAHKVNATTLSGYALNGNMLSIGGAPTNPNYGVEIHKDNWAIITRNTDGSDNAEPKNPRGSIYVNDVYLRSTGKWLSQEGGGGLGYGQSWTTALPGYWTYPAGLMVFHGKNGTSKPIMVKFMLSYLGQHSGSVTYQYISMYTSGYLVDRLILGHSNDDYSSEGGSVSAIIPPGANYEVHIPNVVKVEGHVALQ